MRKVITAKEIESLLRNGPGAVPADAILTPSARDLLLAHQNRANRGSIAEAKPVSDGAKPVVKSTTALVTTTSAAPAKKANEPSTPELEFKWVPGTDPKTPAEIDRFFFSEPVEDLKRRICDIGRRLWVKDYTDGNGGNITVRVGDNLVLCTPTLICKGFMTPEEICLIDLDGNQLAGSRKRTSEAMTHLGIMKRQPAAKACVHAHPPHATAFAIANVSIPSCLIPEAEVFLGKIGVAKYQTPGTPENAEEVGRVGVDHQAVLMQNHGVIVWGKDVEDAYWKMENIDAYCRTVWIAAGLGSGLHRFGTDKLRDLINLRQKLGMPDPRANLKEAELSDSSDFRAPVICATSGTNGATPGAPGNDAPPADPTVEALVTQLTEQILKQLAQRS
jgi:L-fuculose-phosphate aldolase